MIHLWGRNDLGTACIRCGYFSYTAEAGKGCSGRYDEKLISDTEAQIAMLTQKLEMVRKARGPDTTTVPEGKVKE